jgi:hypothetical protein
VSPLNPLRNEIAYVDTWQSCDGSLDFKVGGSNLDTVIIDRCTRKTPDHVTHSRKLYVCGCYSAATAQLRLVRESVFDWRSSIVSAQPRGSLLTALCAATLYASASVG